MTKVKNGDTVFVHYTGKLENGLIFDTSISREPLEVKIGEGMVIPGFENGLLEMSVGEKKVLEIEKGYGYGEKNDYMIQEAPKDKVPQDVKLGDMLQATSPAGPINFTVVEIKEDVVILDGNHPLAGENLVFEVEVVDIIVS
jgi:FKBP-type peptidyl-prolyl cis-trans isomerase 2